MAKQIHERNGAPHDEGRLPEEFFDAALDLLSQFQHLFSTMQ